MEIDAKKLMHANPPLGVRCKGTLCFNTPGDEAFLFMSTFRGGLAIAEAREISINSCASAVGEMDGGMFDFYRTISLYGGTFLLPVNMYLSNLGPICFQETRLEIDIRPVWVCRCTVLDPDGVAEFRRRAYDSQ